MLLAMPLLFLVQSARAVAYLDGWTNQEFELATDGTVTVKKFGYTIVRHRNDP